VVRLRTPPGQMQVARPSVPCPLLLLAPSPGPALPCYPKQQPLTEAPPAALRSALLPVKLPTMTVAVQYTRDAQQLLFYNQFHTEGIREQIPLRLAL